jgi:hypothetical protein
VAETVATYAREFATWNRQQRQKDRGERRTATIRRRNTGQWNSGHGGVVGSRLRYASGRQSETQERTQRLESITIASPSPASELIVSVREWVVSDNGTGVGETRTPHRVRCTSWGTAGNREKQRTRWGSTYLGGVCDSLQNPRSSESVTTEPIQGNAIGDDGARFRTPHCVRCSLVRDRIG